MTPDQVEVLSKVVTLTSGAAAAALALAQLAKTLLEVADQLHRRRRRARRRGPCRPRRGRGPRRPSPARRGRRGHLGETPRRPGRAPSARPDNPPSEICGRVRATPSTVHTWPALESVTPYPVPLFFVAQFRKRARGPTATLQAARSCDSRPNGVLHSRQCPPTA